MHAAQRKKTSMCVPSQWDTSMIMNGEKNEILHSGHCVFKIIGH